MAAASSFGRLVLKGRACENFCEGRPCGQAGLSRRGLGPLGREGAEQIWKGRRLESQKRLRLVLINSLLHQSPILTFCYVNVASLGRALPRPPATTPTKNYVTAPSS